MNVVGVMEYERTFLEPLYKFMALNARRAMRRVPAYVSFISGDRASEALLMFQKAQASFSFTPIQRTSQCDTHGHWGLSFIAKVLQIRTARPGTAWKSHLIRGVGYLRRAGARLS